MNDLISIVVPVYNMGDSLEKCVMSILKQDYSNIEIILVDDGSKDNSYAVCQNLVKIDKRITAYHTENRGSGPARNYGIEHASGKYIYFPDADDYMSENAISKMVEATLDGKYDLVIFGYSILNQSGVQVSIKQYQNVDRKGEIIRLDYFDYMGSSSILGIQGAPWNKLFDLNIIRENAICFPSLRRHQDEGFIARYMCYSVNICFISDVLYTHYINDFKKEWMKYPTDYIDVVIGLYGERNSNILLWNPRDTKTHELVYCEYICNVIKAIELSFSPKFGFNAKQRKAWIKDTIEKSGIANLVIPSIIGNYQNRLIKLMKQHKYCACYAVIKLKVSIERIGMLDAVKRAIGK